MLSSFLRDTVHPMSYCISLPFYARRVDAAWSDEVWRDVSNRRVHRILLECGSEITVLPCFGYIIMGDELFATFPQSIRNMLPSERGAATTVWQLIAGQVDLRLSKMGNDNMYTLQPAVWLERIRFVYDSMRGFSRVQRFLARRAILRKIKARHFTKLAVFIRMIAVSDNAYWRAIQDTGILSEYIVDAYLGESSHALQVG